MKIKGYEVFITIALLNEQNEIVEEFPTLKEARSWCSFHHRPISGFRQRWMVDAVEHATLTVDGDTRQEALHNFSVAADYYSKK
jgi:hypothetical protein